MIKWEITFSGGYWIGDKVRNRWDFQKLAFLLDPPNPVQRPLKNDKGLVLPVLRSRIRAVFKERNINSKMFAGNLLSSQQCVFETYRHFRQEEEVCKRFHFQIYDWLMLSRDDQEKVLRGEPPEHGYFQLPNRLNARDFQNQFRDRANLSLTNDDGTMNAHNLALRLDYELLKNRWTRTQFAFRVFPGSENGEEVAKFIDQDDKRADICEAVNSWLQMSSEDREKVMEHVHIPRIQIPVELRTRM